MSWLYCPRCYEVNGREAKYCARCGAPLRGETGENYVERLIWALHHPQGETAVRAAGILGKLGAVEAVEPLSELVEDGAADPYLRAAAVSGLGAIGDERARKTLENALRNGPVQVRLAAVEALERLGPSEGTLDLLREVSREGGGRVGDAARDLLARWSGGCGMMEGVILA
ncbi:HEAT repeat domain-containing protein [Rubrobacter calidifluminis]|uniref:HEAT repeat domain-containing protein n=1 Tax=Rubrobacter calidifluminis TaxID=1392640 RepID=UPI002362877A|nr:HEAT repeat domain-containing protein [Rubrobacter calidifluminis]